MSISDAYLQLGYSGQGVGKLVGGVRDPGDNRQDSGAAESTACLLVLHLKSGGVFIFNWDGG